MKRLILALLIATLISAFDNRALAVCDCKQPFYKDETDFLIHYTQCLEKCYNSIIKHLQFKLDKYEIKISEFESNLYRINLRVKSLEEKLSSVKTIK